MNRNASRLASLFLMALTLVGLWLASSDTRFLIGLLLALGAGAGFIVLVRRENFLPLGNGEREGWKIVRAKGKRHYVLKSVMSGLFFGLVFLLSHVIMSLWSGEPFTAKSGFFLVAILTIIIGGSYYAAMKKWALYEERYKDSRPTRGAA